MLDLPPRFLIFSVIYETNILIGTQLQELGKMVATINPAFPLVFVVSLWPFINYLSAQDRFESYPPCRILCPLSTYGRIGHANGGKWPQISLFLIFCSWMTVVHAN